MKTSDHNLNNRDRTAGAVVPLRRCVTDCLNLRNSPLMRTFSHQLPAKIPPYIIYLFAYLFIDFVTTVLTAQANSVE